MKMLTMAIIAALVVAVGVMEVLHFQNPSNDVTTQSPKVDLQR